MHLSRRNPTDKKEEQSLEVVQKMIVSECLTQSQHSGATPEEVKEKLHELWRKKYLITESVHQWAMKRVMEVFAQEETLSCDSTDMRPPADSQCTEPLFSKDTIYHASICCQALTCYTAGDYQKFFKDTQKVPGHSFQAVSISRPTPDSKQHERYLISKQGRSKYYIAFESQPVLSQWPKKCNSFIEGYIFNACMFLWDYSHSLVGVEIESEKFPIRYIVELLNNEGCTIVLTGNMCVT